MSGFFYNQLKNICESLGKHNDAIYAVLAIAMFKGVMRPTFTMMDKKSDPKAKKYAAFREGLTEAIAFASYLVTHKLIQYAIKPLAKKTGASPKKIKNGLSLLSVCLTAGIVIPVVCNLTLKPIMDGVSKIWDKKRKKASGKFDIKEKNLMLTSNSELGNTRENITVGVKGNDLNISFNSKYFSDCLRVIDNPYVKMNFNSQIQPCVITPSEGDDFLFLILPVKAR